MQTVVDKYVLVENMLRYGGSFISKLAEAMIAADPTNFKRLCDAFPDVIEKYSSFSHR